MKYCYGNLKKKFDLNGTLELLKNYKEGLDKKAQESVCYAVLPEFFSVCEKAGYSVMQQNIKLNEIDSRVKGKMILIGHSDYRVGEGESTQLVNQKLEALLKNGAKVLLCCGDGAEQFENGTSKEHVIKQLKDAAKYDREDLIIAYEPIYAIGGTVAAELKDVMPIILEIKKMFKKAKVFYGGSFNANNAERFFAQKEIDGALIGTAVTKFETFFNTIEICRKL